MGCLKLVDRLRERDDGINPLWLVERLRNESTTMQLGLIHGDLHPGNVIVRDHDAPAIIDFGWTAARAHIAKDFVLMECNLRFLTLRPQIAETELTTFANAFAWDAATPAFASEHLAKRWDLIQVVRDAAREVFAPNTDWNREYIAPMFMVAFGLLRFAPHLGNQPAAIRFVEGLAVHLAHVLDLK